MPTLDTVYSTLGMWMPGHSELVVLLVIILIIFGPKQLPALARSVGKSITDFKRGISEIKDDIDKAGDESGEKKDIADTVAATENDTAKSNKEE